MKLFVSVPILLLLVGFILWSDTMAYRSLSVGVYKCQYSQIVNLPEDMDLVVIGSSRVRIAIDARYLQRNTKVVTQAYNLGLGGSNSLRNYSWLKSVYDAGYRPKFVVMETDLRDLYETRQGYWEIDNWEIMGTYADFLDLPNAYDQPFWNDYYHVAGRAVKKLDVSLGLLLQGRFIEGMGAASDGGSPKVCLPNRFDKDPSKKDLNLIERIREANLEYEKENLTPYRPVESVKISDSTLRELYYLQKIRDLTAKYDSTLIVTRPWKVYERPLSPEQLVAIQETIPEFVFPPDDVVRSTWTSFKDNTHMYREASEIYTDWLIEVLESQAADGL